MPYINVDEAYILDNTGLQVDQAVDIPFVDAGFTDTQKAQARKNIAAGGTNPNLLDNPFFTVNQRGASGAVTTSNYYLDRWRCTYASGVNTIVGTGFVTFDTGTANGDLVQPIETLPLGKTVTISALLSDGTIESVTGTTPAATPASASWIITGDGENVKLRLRWSGTLWQVYVTPIVKPVTVNAVKLELGSVSTLANDVPPNYAEELAKCQFYCRNFAAIGSTIMYIGGGFANSTTQARFEVPVSMRATTSIPTVTTTGSIEVLCNGTWYAVTGTSSTWATNNNTGITLFATVSSGLTQNAPCVLRMNNNASLLYSVDL